MRVAASLIFLLLSAGCSPPATNSEADMASIARLHASDERAVLSGDTAALISLWTDDIVAMVPGQPIRRGRPANVQALRESMRAGRDFVPLTYHLDFDTVELHGDHAIEWGRYRGSARHLETGKIVSSGGVLLRVLRRERDGEWRVARTIFTTDEHP